MRDTDRLELVLREEYGNNINVVEVKPLHDDFFDAGYAVCYKDVIVANAEDTLKSICEAIERERCRI